MDPVFPPLAGSEYLKRPVRELTGIVVNGLAGEITVKGKKYNGAMPSHAFLTDEQVADVVTFVRNSWGSSESAATIDDVRSVRNDQAH